MTVGAIVLAAGLGTRMGGAKPAMSVNGRPMVAHVLAAAHKAGLPALLVVGAHANVVRAAAPNIPTVHAANYASGLSHSLKAGLQAAPASWTAALILLADMPFVTAETLQALATALRSGAPAVVPTHDGRRGNPAGFTRATWPGLMALQGDRGARSLLDDLCAQEVEVDDPGIHRDLDRPQDIAP